MKIKAGTFFMNVCLFLAFSFHSMLAQSQSEELKVERERTFTGAGLYGFMNGGADLYMEYGVMSLITRDVIYIGEKYTIDIYEMPTPEDAYGIYSMHVFRCQRADNDKCIDCLSSYQLQVVSGNRYVSVVFPSGSTIAQQGADELIRFYVSLEDSKNRNIIPELIVSKPPYSGVVKYLKGPLSVSTVSRGLTALLKGHTYTGVWYTEDKKEDTYQALIYLADKEQTEVLKREISSDCILQTGMDFIYMKGKELEEEVQDYGPFGF